MRCRDYAEQTTLTKKSEMHQPEWLETPVAEQVAEGRADEVSEEELDEDTDAGSTTAHTAKWTIIPPKHAERES
jgi:hypothetical protein